jgi:formate dehydrogenase subunit gamma
MSVEPSSDRLVRYDFGERVAHACAALTYVYLLLTGLAFWMPALYWLTILAGGGYLARELHPWVGLLFNVAVIWMYVRWRRDMRTTDADRAWRRAVLHYIRNEDDRVPPAGRFNFGQKQFFWVMVLGTLLTLVSGIALWVPWLVAPDIRPAAVVTHAVASLVTIAAIIVHIYMGLVVVPGGLGAILNGTVSEEWARYHHALWAAEKNRTAAPPSPVTSDRH